MPTTLGIAPSDNHKLFSVEAFDPKPCTPVGFIPAIDALRHDVLNTVLARQPMKGRAMVNLVIVVAQTIRRTIQQRFQPGLPVHQWQSHQVLAIQVEEVEQEKD